LIELALYDDSS